MSALTNSYNKITNQGVPIGLIVHNEEHQILGRAKFTTTTVLGGGTATIEVDNGNGFIAETMLDGINNYDLQNCTFRILLTAGATVATS